MYDRILFPTDGSDVAASALEYALDVASDQGATLHVLNVADTTRQSVSALRGEVIDTLEREGERIVSAAADRARDRGVDVATEVLQGVPSETIVGYADATDVDLIVMPTHGTSGLERVLLGSVTERVVTSATVPVLIVPEEGPDESIYPFRDVLVPVDGSRGAEVAVREGADVASATGAKLHLLHVVERASLGVDVRSAETREELDARANDLLDEAEATARDRSADGVTRTVAYGSPFREIRSYVRDEDVDAIVLGVHGETDFSRYVLGGVSSKLLRASPVPLVLVRDPDEVV